MYHHLATMLFFLASSTGVFSQVADFFPNNTAIVDAIKKHGLTMNVPDVIAAAETAFNYYGMPDGTPQRGLIWGRDKTCIAEWNTEYFITCKTSVVLYSYKTKPVTHDYDGNPYIFIGHMCRTLGGHVTVKKKVKGYIDASKKLIGFRDWHVANELKNFYRTAPYNGFDPSFYDSAGCHKEPVKR